MIIRALLALSTLSCAVLAFTYNAPEIAFEFFAWLFGLIILTSITYVLTKMLSIAFWMVIGWYRLLYLTQKWMDYSNQQLLTTFSIGVFVVLCGVVYIVLHSKYRSHFLYHNTAD